jgi:hypothetical protein
MLERINVALRGFFDKIPVEHLPTVLLVPEPPGTDLEPIVQPIRGDASQPTDGCAGERS